jgi:hypothetical protein
MVTGGPLQAGRQACGSVRAPYVDAQRHSSRRKATSVPAGNRAHDATRSLRPLIPSSPMAMARPEGSEHAPPTIVIEGVEALVEALRAA